MKSLEIAMKAVHPRVGGEHNLIDVGGAVKAGSSPRGRGTHLMGSHIPWVTRFIPAWAGNTRPVFTSRNPWAVHPRVGGEHGWCRL